MKKKIVAYLLCMAMGVSLMPMPVTQAADNGAVVYEEPMTETETKTTETETTTDTRTEISFSENQYLEMETPGKDWTSQQATETVKLSKNDENYSIDSVSWYDITNNVDNTNPMKDEEKFQEGNKYTAKVTLKVKNDNEKKFGDNSKSIKIKIDQSDAKEFEEKDIEISDDGKKMTLSYSFSIEHVHTYQAEWTWKADYTEATLKISCTSCGAVQMEGITVPSQESITESPTCIKPGTKTYTTATVKVNGQSYSDTKKVDIPATGHKMTIKEESWEYSTDGQNWEAIDENTKLSAEEAKNVKVRCTPITKCEKDDKTEKGTAITGSKVENESQEPGCTEGGYYTYTVKVEGKDVSEKVAIGKTGHNMTITGGRWEYKTEGGKWETIGTDTKLSAEEAKKVEVHYIPIATCDKNDKTEERDAVTGSKVENESQEPGCTEDGYYTYTVKVEGKDVSEKVAIEKTGHSMSITGGRWEYKTDGKNWKAIDENIKLSAEEAKKVEVRYIPIATCDKNDKTEERDAVTGSKVENESQEPGCTEDGYYTYTVKVEGKDVSEKVAIGKTGHSMSITGGRWEYSTDGENWKTIDKDTKLSAEEAKKVEVRYIPIATCDKNDKTEERDAVTGSKVEEKSQEPGCTEDGYYTYTVKVEGKDVSEKVAIEKTGHSMSITGGRWEYKTDGKNWKAIDENIKLSAEEAKKVEVRYIPIATCDKNDKTEERDAVTGSKVEEKSQEPGCTEDGYYTYTVKVEGKDVSEKVAIGKTGHSMSITGGRWEYSTDGENWKTIDKDAKLSAEEVSKVEVRYIPIATCDKNDKTEERDAVTGSKVEEKSQEPGCTEDGYYTYEATITDEQGNSTKKTQKVVIKATGHDIEKIEAVSATCDKDGNIEYYHCKTCGKYFLDADGQNAIEEGSWIVKATGHKLEKTEEVAATCEKDGNDAYYTCKNENCGRYFSDKEGKNEIKKDSWVRKATGHQIVEEVKKQPTKKVEGQLVRHCKNCDYVKETLALPKKEITIYVGAKAKEVPKVASTYNTSDYKISYAKAKNAKTYGKYFSLKNANKTGNLKVTIKANSKKLSQVKLSTVPLKVTVAGKEYKTNVKVKIKAPKITISKESLEIGGIKGIRYHLKYNVKGATRVKIRVRKASSLSKKFDSDMSNPKSDASKCYITVRESDLKRYGNKLTFEIVAYYGNNISEKYVKTVK